MLARSTARRLGHFSKHCRQVFVRTLTSLMMTAYLPEVVAVNSCNNPQCSRHQRHSAKERGRVAYMDIEM